MCAFSSSSIRSRLNIPAMIVTLVRYAKSEHSVQSDDNQESFVLMSSTTYSIIKPTVIFIIYHTLCSCQNYPENSWKVQCAVAIKSLNLSWLTLVIWAFRHKRTRGHRSPRSRSASPGSWKSTLHQARPARRSRSCPWPEQTAWGRGEEETGGL